jgi:hypothetical protein
MKSSASPRPAALRLHRPDARQDLKDQVHDRLKALLELDHQTGCWVYVGPWQPATGLGVIRVAGRQFTAHRVAAWLWVEDFELADRSVRVRHTCRDCPACCAPEHLRVERKAAVAQRRAA